jgi:hypothetical protein
MKKRSNRKEERTLRRFARLLNSGAARRPRHAIRGSSPAGVMQPVKALVDPRAHVADVMETAIDYMESKPSPLSFGDTKELLKLPRNRTQFYTADGSPARRTTRRAFRINIVNQILRQGLAFPQITGFGKSGEVLVRWMPDPRADDAQRLLIAAIQTLIYIAERGLLSRLHRCPGCRLWFHGRPNQKFHPGLTCKTLHYKEWKTKYMKKYMKGRRDEEKRKTEKWFEERGTTPSRRSRG